MGILSGCSHRYYVQNKSVSKSFSPNRVDSDVILHNAVLSLAEKLRKYRRIAENPITLAAYRECTEESESQSREVLLRGAVDEPLLCQIDDPVFLKKYGEIYWGVWQGDHLAALDDMTGLLMEDRVRDGRETFLKLYLSLAASQDQAPAFVFGKLQLAGLYLDQNRLPESLRVVEELEEMGLGEEAEVQELRSKLENMDSEGRQ